jgi:hypothetical protein
MDYLKFFICVLCLSNFNAESRVRDLETTRLMSTSGAGVASVLVNESSFLNPASIVFVASSAFYYQRGSSSLDNEAKTRTKDFSDGSNEIYLLSDASSTLKGTFSYQKQAENQFRRQRFTSSFASNYGKRTAIGILYRYTIDEEIRDNDEKKFHQGSIGITHILSEKLSFGAVLVDPFLSNKEDARLIGGAQYNLFSNLLLILDYGVNFNDKPHENTVTKGAVQLNFFRDLFLRGGRFEDKITGLSGNSWGLSWIGPRIALEYAIKNSEVIDEKSDYLLEEEKITESSLSLAVIF